MIISGCFSVDLGGFSCYLPGWNSKRQRPHGVNPSAQAKQHCWVRTSPHERITTPAKFGHF